MPLPLVVYTTGGDDFPSVQALIADGDSDMIPDAAGEVGVGEHLLTIPKQADKFGTAVRGAATVTVTRSMAGDDGKVYLFGYFDNDDPDGDAQEFLIDGMFDINRDGVISGDDVRVSTTNDDVATMQIIGGGFNAVRQHLVNGSSVDDVVQVINNLDDLDGGSDTAVGYLIVDGQMYVISAAVSGAPPVSLGIGWNCGSRAHNAD